MRWDYPPLDINPVFPGLGVIIIIIIIIIIVIYIIIIIIIVVIFIIIIIIIIIINIIIKRFNKSCQTCILFGRFVFINVRNMSERQQSSGQLHEVVANLGYTNVWFTIIIFFFFS